MLNDILIRNAAPKKKSYKIYDGGGLGLLLEVSPRGSKLWRVQLRGNGRGTLRSLGQWPDVGLKEAREKAEAMRGGKHLLKPGGRENFRQVAADWAAQFLPRLVPRSQARMREYLDNRILPALGSLYPDEITTSAVLRGVLRPIAEAGNIATVLKVKCLLSQIFRYAVATGAMERDFTLELRKAFPARQIVHRPAITEPAKLGGLLRAVDAYSGSPVVKAALFVLPYVFVRPGELRQARWEEFSFWEALWRIPAARMKMRAAHVVPLARQVVSRLEDLYLHTGHGPLLFPGIWDKTRPISDMSINAALRRLGYQGDEVCGHGFRTTASTLLNERGYPCDWIELQLAHRPGGVRAVYNRAGRRQERERMMQERADYLDSLREGGAAA
jgi:integrase